MKNTLIHRMREELRLESQCKAKGCEALFVKWQHRSHCRLRLVHT